MAAVPISLRVRWRIGLLEAGAAPPVIAGRGLRSYERCGRGEPCGASQRLARSGHEAVPRNPSPLESRENGRHRRCSPCCCPAHPHPFRCPHMALHPGGARHRYGGLWRARGGGFRTLDHGMEARHGRDPATPEAAWEHEFEKYRQIPQYELVNKGMNLSEFKAIYFWEWGRRPRAGSSGSPSSSLSRAFGSARAISGRLALALLKSERWEGFRRRWAGSWSRRASSPA